MRTILRLTVNRRPRSSTHSNLFCVFDIPSGHGSTQFYSSSSGSFFFLIFVDLCNTVPPCIKSTYSCNCRTILLEVLGREYIFTVTVTDHDAGTRTAVVRLYSLH